MSVIFTISSTNYEYRAESVEVQRVWLGKRRELADRSNKIFTDGYYLKFTVRGDQLEGATKDPRDLQLDLEDETETVQITVNGAQYEVVSTMESSTLYATRYGARSDEDIVECITVNKVNRLELEKFTK